MKKLVLGSIALFSACVAADPAVQDHYKVETVKTPYYVEVCREELMGGDKTGDTLGGALVGAAIGNAIGKDTEATVAGAAIGGLIGHNKSDAKPMYQTRCREEVKYDSSTRKIYSHSTITFVHDGKTYVERFYKEH